MKSRSIKVCESCRRLGGEDRMYGSARVVLCDECDRNPFHRGKAIADARGEKWDPASIGRPTR